jgi:hypothetical protein
MLPPAIPPATPPLHSPCTGLHSCRQRNPCPLPPLPIALPRAPAPACQRLQISSRRSLGGGWPLQTERGCWRESTPCLRRSPPSTPPCSSSGSRASSMQPPHFVPGAAVHSLQSSALQNRAKFYIWLHLGQLQRRRHVNQISSVEPAGAASGLRLNSRLQAEWVGGAGRNLPACLTSCRPAARCAGRRWGCPCA